MRRSAHGRSGRQWILHSIVVMVFSAGSALASLVTPVVPTLPSPSPTPIPTTDYNLTVSNPNIDGGAVISTSNTAAQNATVINDAMTYVSSQGGGVIEIPPTSPGTATTYSSSAITVQSNIDFQIDGSTTLQAGVTGGTLLISGGNAVSNFELSGSGSLSGGAPKSATGDNLVDITKLSYGTFTGVTIANSGQEHLVVEASNNITINDININDKGTLAANNNKYVANTDGIDYNGTNFLIENSTISDGDDDIVAKSGGNLACSEITVENNTIHAGHGISVGGGTSKTLNDYLVTANVFNPLDPTLTGSGTINTISYGLRLKAGDVSGGDAGGLANNLTFSNNTLTNVQNPIAIESFYNGGDIFPSSPIPGQDTKGASPAYTSPLTSASGGNIPYWENVLFSGDTITGASNAGLITGLSFSPANIQDLEFLNTSIQASSQMDLWYAANVDLSGLTVVVPTSNAYFIPTAQEPVSGVYLYGVTGMVVPEPSMMALGAVGIVGLIARRRRN